MVSENYIYIKSWSVSTTLRCRVVRNHTTERVWFPETLHTHTVAENYIFIK